MCIRDRSLYGANHDELPMVSFGISIEGGMLLDNPNKIGVANLVSDMMMEGTANKTPIELEEAIDDLGSSIYTYTSKQAIYIEVNTLKRNFVPTLEIVEEILFEPRWDSAEFDRIKRKTAENIKRRSAVPSSIASNVYNKLNYGDHILSNATLGTVETVENIVLNDLKEYINTNFSAHFFSPLVLVYLASSSSKLPLYHLQNKFAIPHYLHEEKLRYHVLAVLYRAYVCHTLSFFYLYTILQVLKVYKFL